MSEAGRIGVLGAGAIGCWLGGKLALAGEDVVLVGRDWLREAVDANGLVLTDLDGSVAKASVRVETGPECLADCAVVLVAVKGKDTVSAAEQARPHLADGTVVVSCQNGLTNAERLTEALPDQAVHAGMVSFNVVRTADHAFKRGTSGPIAVAASSRSEAIVAALQGAGLHTEARPDMERVLSTKLVFNVNNAVNALSDLPLVEQLQEPSYRRLVADTMDEARAVLAAAGRPPVRIHTLIPWLAPKALRLPTPLFRLVARSMLAMDPQARSSMWEDLSRGRSTEVDDLNGVVVELGEAHGVPTPVNRALRDWVKAVDAPPGLSADAIRGGP